MEFTATALWGTWAAFLLKVSGVMSRIAYTGVNQQKSGAIYVGAYFSNYISESEGFK